MVNEDKAPAQFGGVLKVLEGADRADAKAFVKDVLSIAGIAKVGGRDSNAIAERFLRRAAGETGALSKDIAESLKRFLTIAGEPDQALGDIRAFAKAEGVALGEPIALMESRIGFMAAQGVDLSTLRFETAFLRNLDYYTGFVFDVPSAMPASR